MICAAYGKAPIGEADLFKLRGIEAVGRRRCIKLLELDGRRHVVRDSGVLVAREEVLNEDIPMVAETMMKLWPFRSLTNDASLKVLALVSSGWRSNQIRAGERILRFPIRKKDRSNPS